MQGGPMPEPTTDGGPAAESPAYPGFVLPARKPEVTQPALAEEPDEFQAPIPLSDHVLVQRLPAVTKVGGILLPGEAQTKPKMGTVLSVGPGRSLEDGSLSKMELKGGDVVYFSPYAGLNLEEVAREDSCMVMRQDDVLCRAPREGETAAIVKRQR
jgi:chaperonin GroES